MGDFGMKVSQLGWDIKIAGDANLYLSSSWPILKIEDTQVLTSDNSVKTVNHKLGYPPLALAWTPTTGLTSLAVNSNSITISGASFTDPTIRYWIFRLPLNKFYQSSIVDPNFEPTGNVDHNFGFKASKSGKDTKSTDYRDFTLHSSARSPTLHAVIYQAIANSPIYGVNNGLIWHSDLPYRPVYFAFWSSDNINFTPVSTISQSPPKVIYGTPYGITDNSIELITGSSTGYGSLVILKDPLDSRTNYTSITL